MNQQQILERAMQKANDGGWSPAGLPMNLADTLHWLRNWSTRDIIFNHDFAKALWGETTDYTVVNMPYPDTPPRAYLYQNGYKYHLQQMVIADDPIKYLSENV
ncbi:hypothetical protein [Streptomyces sp. BBFR109]|uniref:hypothetical protein n=1 Tax=Streptomyces sp. BBFR109 TaxID=3448172 RepID=UPI003F77668A